MVVVWRGFVVVGCGVFVCGRVCGARCCWSGLLCLRGGDGRIGGGIGGGGGGCLVRGRCLSLASMACMW